MPAIEFENPLGHIVKEVTIMGDRDHRARVLLKVLLKPLHTFRVKVVGWLIQEQQIRLPQ